MIEIKIVAHTPREFLEQLNALAYAYSDPQVGLATTPSTGNAALAAYANVSAGQASSVSTGEAQEHSDDLAASAGQRERGKPGPGRARRTKAEIAEDEAAEVAEASGEKAQISTGENRVGPEDSPETEAQDAADEAAEAAQNQSASATLEDVRSAAGEYMKKFGPVATQADGAAILQAALGKPPEGEAGWKMSLIPNDPAQYARAVAAFKEALEKNPFERDLV